MNMMSMKNDIIGEENISESFVSSISLAFSAGTEANFSRFFCSMGIENDVIPCRKNITAADIQNVLDYNHLTHEDITWFLLHQANKRIIEGIRNIIGGPEEKYPTIIEKYGNTSSASIPIMLDEMLRAGKIKEGDKIIMSAFGAGFVSAACLWEWEF